MERDSLPLVIIIAIIILFIVKPPLNWFAITTITTCIDDTISYWDLDGNLLDSRGLNNGINHGALYSAGKVGTGISFNTTSYIEFPFVQGKSIIMWSKDSNSNSWDLLSIVDGVTYVNGILDSRNIFLIGDNFGFGFNGSIDEIAVFNRSLSQNELINIYNNPQPVCYNSFVVENITCKDYATEMNPDIGSGCLKYSGDFFPNCSYSIEPNTKYYGEDCSGRFYCEDITSSDYNDLDSCQNAVSPQPVTPPATYSSTPSPTSSVSLSKETFIDKLDKEVNIFGFSITFFYLSISLIVIGGIVYLLIKK